MAKESVYIRKELNSHRIGLVYQLGCRFIDLKNQYGCHDIECTCSILTVTHGFLIGTKLWNYSWCYFFRKFIKTYRTHSHKETWDECSGIHRAVISFLSLDFFFFEIDPLDFKSSVIFSYPQLRDECTNHEETLPSIYLTKVKVMMAYKSKNTLYDAVLQAHFFKKSPFGDLQ